MKKYTFNSAQLCEMLALGDEDREQFVSYIENIEEAGSVDSVECPDVEVVRQFAAREMKRHRRRVATAERRRRRAEQTPETPTQTEEVNSRLAEGVTFTREDLRVLDDDRLVYLCWLAKVVDSVVYCSHEVLSRLSLTVGTRVTRFLADYKRLVRSIYSQLFDTPRYRSMSLHLDVAMTRLRLPHRY